MVPRYLGVRTVIAKSFARIHLANLVNFGLLPLVFVNREDYDSIAQEDLLSLDTETLRADTVYTIHNKTQGKDFAATTPLTREELDIVKVGGRLNWIKLKN